MGLLGEQGPGTENMNQAIEISQVKLERWRLCLGVIGSSFHEDGSFASWGEWGVR